VSCAPSGFCIAIGNASAARGADIRWQSAYLYGTWTPIGGTGGGPVSTGGKYPVPRPSLSCASETTCALADVNFDGLSVWDGLAWRSTPASLLWWTPTFLGRASVSCGAPASCVAVRNGDAAIWNGLYWQGWAGAVPGAERVACVTAAFCLATGGGTAYHWNGIFWAAVGPIGGEVTGLTCWAVDACAVAGHRPEPVGVQWFLKSWNGFGFVDAPSPPPADIFDLSCSSLRQCFAVRAESHVSRPDASTTPVYLTGAGWQEAPIPPSADRQYPRLGAVSCRLSWCVAAGAADDAQGNAVAIAYRWGFGGPQA
jgi:hypothetical protein